MLSAAGFAAAAAAAAAEEQDDDDEEEEQAACFVGAVDGSQRGDGADGSSCPFRWLPLTMSSTGLRGAERDAHRRGQGASFCRGASYWPMDSYYHGNPPEQIFSRATPPNWRK